jgi:hypothetical protein
VSNDDRTPEPAGGHPAPDLARTPQYEICVGGHLGKRWAAWFDGMTLADEDDGTTVIRGPVVDQAALHGLPQTLRDLGITLLSLTRLPSATAVEQPVLPPDHDRHHQPGATS